MGHSKSLSLHEIEHNRQFDQMNVSTNEQDRKSEIDRKMEEMRIKNLEMLKRHKEIEEDRQQAEQTGAIKMILHTDGRPRTSKGKHVRLQIPQDTHQHPTERIHRPPMRRKFENNNRATNNELPQRVDYNKLKRQRQYEINNQNNNNVNPELLEYAYPYHTNRSYHDNNAGRIGSGRFPQTQSGYVGGPRRRDGRIRQQIRPNTDAEFHLDVPSVPNWNGVYNNTRQQSQQQFYNQNNNMNNNNNTDNSLSHELDYNNSNVNDVRYRSMPTSSSSRPTYHQNRHAAFVDNGENNQTTNDFIPPSHTQNHHQQQSYSHSTTVVHPTRTFQNSNRLLNSNHNTNSLQTQNEFSTQTEVPPRFRRLQYQHQQQSPTYPDANNNHDLKHYRSAQNFSLTSDQNNENPHQQQPAFRHSTNTNRHRPISGDFDSVHRPLDDNSNTNNAYANHERPPRFNQQQNRMQRPKSFYDYSQQPGQQQSNYFSKRSTDDYNLSSRARLNRHQDNTNSLPLSAYMNDNNNTNHQYRQRRPQQQFRTHYDNNNNMHDEFDAYRLDNFFPSRQRNNTGVNNNRQYRMNFTQKSTQNRRGHGSALGRGASEFVLPTDDFWEDNHTDLIGTPLHEENPAHLDADDDSLSNTSENTTNKNRHMDNQQHSVKSSSELSNDDIDNNSTSQDGIYLSPSAGMGLSNYDDVTTFDTKIDAALKKLEDDLKMEEAVEDELSKGFKLPANLNDDEDYNDEMNLADIDHDLDVASSEDDDLSRQQMDALEGELNTKLTLTSDLKDNSTTVMTKEEKSLEPEKEKNIQITELSINELTAATA
ncbi:unnamed protein product [Didymodactylos carnosus]|uniref:Uncharacterized protein n=1 Tax=Didymodactylos carnosus TaxID=1234261 RepID=A0A8S2CU27_9BILA|nr:unnamed protein product [Didymodactylos carnosus]CAF3506195.1 unnamed protein product [Didymodactylos carnosus]